MRSAKLGAAAALSMVGAAGAAHADTGDWYARVGPAQISLADKATLAIGGGAVPGAGYSSKDQYTLAAEFGYHFTPHLALALTVGIPPTVKAEGSGSLTAFGRLGETTYGPSALTALYNFNPTGTVDFYIGGGVSYMHIFDTKDGVLTNLEVEDDFGPAVQTGAEYRLNDRWGLFVDYKKAWLESKATGRAFGAPAISMVKFDPSVVTAGVSIRF